MGIIILSFLVVIFGHFGIGYLRYEYEYKIAEVNLWCHSYSKNDSECTDTVQKNGEEKDSAEKSPRRESMISAVKKAKHKALKKAMERNMTDDEREREPRASSEMLAKYG